MNLVNPYRHVVAGGSVAQQINITWHQTSDTPYPPDPVSPDTANNVMDANLNESASITDCDDFDGNATGIGISVTAGGPSNNNNGGTCANARFNDAHYSNTYHYTGSSVTYTLTGFDANEVVDLYVFCSMNNSGGATMQLEIEGVDESGVFEIADSGSGNGTTDIQVLMGMQADASGNMDIKIQYVDDRACINCLGIDRY